MINKRVVALVLTQIVILHEVGCSLVAPSVQELTIDTSDQGADIFVNERHVGTGSATVMVLRDAPQRIQVRRHGFSNEVVVKTKLSTTGWLDLVGGFLFLLPFVGLFASGSRTLEVERIWIEAPPERGPMSEERK